MVVAGHWQVAQTRVVRAANIVVAFLAGSVGTALPQQLVVVRMCGGDTTYSVRVCVSSIE